MDSFAAFLNWMTGSSGGAFVLIAWFVAWFLEEFAWWKQLMSKIKILIILGASFVLGVGCVALQQNPELVKAIDPFFRPIMYIVLAWLATQASHKSDPNKNK